METSGLAIHINAWRPPIVAIPTAGASCAAYQLKQEVVGHGRVPGDAIAGHFFGNWKSRCIAKIGAFSSALPHLETHVFLFRSAFLFPG